MTSSFSFSFAGDDIEDTGQDTTPAKSTAPPPPASAFPVPGKPQLPPTSHDLQHMLARLPSKIAYGTLAVTLDNGDTLEIPRRELWDVRVQLMAEDDGQREVSDGLGTHDVKTGVYEGGFKSWESSVDMVKVLASGDYVKTLEQRPLRLIELGCGTALPSVAMFQWTLRLETSATSKLPLTLILADYNATVLQLVTLPNFILAWALEKKDNTLALQEAFSMEGELELTPEVLQAFQDFLHSSNISFSFMSGGWSADWVELLYNLNPALGDKADYDTLLLGSETIYSPFALSAFTETMFSILRREQSERVGSQSRAVVAAKRLYFGVGGSLDDFIEKAKAEGAVVSWMREETEGVRRGVVLCVLNSAVD